MKARTLPGAIGSTLPIFLTLAVAACASVGSLVAGQSSVDDVRRILGEPALSWRGPDGSQRLAYPRGPAGFQTLMVDLDATGQLRRVENVLDAAHFADVVPGMDKQQVLRLLGPSQPQWTIYFKARDELAWEWRYCDDWNSAARFDVLFDATREMVRSTLSIRESCNNDNCTCGR